jgi:hypothetical protein
VNSYGLPFARPRSEPEQLPANRPTPRSHGTSAKRARPSWSCSPSLASR